METDSFQKKWLWFPFLSKICPHQRFFKPPLLNLLVMEFVAELLVGAYGLPTFNWFSFALKAIVPLQNWCPASKIRMDERV